jgi:hypothetical protein
LAGRSQKERWVEGPETGNVTKVFGFHEGLYVELMVGNSAALFLCLR